MPDNKPGRAVLSKSTFIRGVQCEKSLYLHKKRPFLRDRISARQLAVFSRGTRVGVFARELFPGGVDASPKSHFQMAAAAVKTLEYIAAGETVIYEAAFQYSGVVIALDILVKEQDGWKAVEVKSSRSISDTYLWDAALQYHVINGNGIHLKDFCIAHIDEQYVREDAIDPARLFRLQGVMDEVQQRQEEVALKIARFHEVVNLKSSPPIGVGPQCNSPYPCDFTGHCWKKIPQGSVFQLHGLTPEKKFSYFEQGIVHASQIPAAELDQQLERQVKALAGDAVMADQEKLHQFLTTINEPATFLSVLWGQPAMPLFGGMRPYQPLAFSMATDSLQESSGGRLLKVIPIDEPMQQAHLQMLLNVLKGYQSILVFDVPSHTRILKTAAGNNPHLEEAVGDLCARMTDLQTPFVNGTIVWPAMDQTESPEDILRSMKRKVQALRTKPTTLLEASLLYQQLISPGAEVPAEEALDAIGKFHQTTVKNLRTLWQMLKELSQ